MTFKLILLTIALIAILIELLALDQFLAVAALCCFGLIYDLVLQLASKLFLSDRQISEGDSTKVINSLHEEWCNRSRHLLAQQYKHT